MFRTPEWTYCIGCDVPPFEDVPDTRMDILIGCDVPETHWVLDQRVGGRRDPYAVRMIFGCVWTRVDILIGCDVP
ncbi:unnamed protein product [Echinostoma caproni]|uniref:DUF1618 domain-containing protein n=1 Tax=Echinostoma caproni TaxID=27848 RepID=A0A183B8T6_9TREM|nr:unnamed protein product [Echinostoma caproni]